MMTHSQSLGAGETPGNLDLNGKANTFSHSLLKQLPLIVWNVFRSMMDRDGLCIMRLVCIEWQKIVEESIGLKVKVDDSIDGNLEFVKRVKVVRARILNWVGGIGTKPAHYLFQHAYWLQKLKICGKMPAQWKIHELRQFPNLAHLVVRDAALHSNNLTGHQYAINNVDPTSELSSEELLIKAFETQEPPKEGVELKSLQTLEIVRHGNYDHYAAPSTFGYLVMMLNLCFLLSTLSSPVLSVVHLAVELPDRLRHSFQKVNWTLAPLHRFLDNHRKTLRQLLLPTLIRSPELFILENLSRTFPTNLQKMMLSIHGDPNHPTQQGSPLHVTFTYLQNCLQKQTQLQAVRFHFFDFPLKWTSDAFTSLANSCGRTLKFIELGSVPDQITGSFDFNVLSICHSLEVLQMPFWGHSNMVFSNLEQLPTSLRRLIICGGFEGHINISHPHVFKRFPLMEWISLFRLNIHIASNSLNHGVQLNFCREMIRGLLGLKKLQGFYLEVKEVGLNTDVSLVKMLSPLDPNINPRSHPNSITSFNMYWWWLPPWSDRPFDMDVWDMEKKKDDEEETTRATPDFYVTGPNEVGVNEKTDEYEDDLYDDKNSNADDSHEAIDLDEHDINCTYDDYD